MDLTLEQFTALKAALLAETNATFVQYLNDGATGLMKDWLNGNKSPVQKAWRDNVQSQESDEVTPWTAFDGLAAGKRESWAHAFLRYPRNYTKQSVRKWITDVWGAATAGSNAEAILTGAGLRNISRVEAMIGGTSTATTNNVTALKLDWEGPITEYQVVVALTQT